MRVFDGHCDTILRCYLDGTTLRDAPERHLDLKRTEVFSSYAQLFALFGDTSHTRGKTLQQVFREEYAVFQRELLNNQARITFCRSAAEAERAFAEGKAAAFLSVEGAEMLDCSLEGLQEAYDLGVRAVNLTWNRANALSGSVAEEPKRGLSAEGSAFVNLMQNLGMLVDVSHLSDPGFWDVIELAQKPVFASHSNSRAICPHRRNLTDAQFSALVRTNGVAGLNLYTAFLGENATLDTVVAHLEHFWSLDGEDHVSLGGDWDGCDSLPKGMEQGIAGLERLYEFLLRRNYSETRIQKLYFTNLMRVVSNVCTM